MEEAKKLLKRVYELLTDNNYKALDLLSDNSIDASGLLDDVCEYLNKE